MRVCLIGTLLFRIKNPKCAVLLKTHSLQDFVYFLTYLGESDYVHKLSILIYIVFVTLPLNMNGSYLKKKILCRFFNVFYFMRIPHISILY